jgi:hypothetical protein
MINKKSFVMHIDQGEVFSELSDADAGKFIKAIFEYQCGRVPNLPKDLNLAFISFRQQYKRDSEKYDEVCKRNEANGKLGGRPKIKTKNPVGFMETQLNPVKPKKADNDNESVSDTDKKSDIDYHPERDLIKFPSKNNSTYPSELLAYSQSLFDTQKAKSSEGIRNPGRYIQTIVNQAQGEFRELMELLPKKNQADLEQAAGDSNAYARYNKYQEELGKYNPLLVNITKKYLEETHD